MKHKKQWNESRKPLDDTPRRRGHQYKKRRWSWQSILGISLIIVSLVIFSFEPIKNKIVSSGVESARVSNFTRQQIIDNMKRNVTFDLDEIDYINPLEVISDGINPNDLPVIGGISIPALEVNLPINKGTSNAGMYYGAGTIWKGQVMGESNYVLASHNSNQQGVLFNPLANMEDDPEYYESLKLKVYLTDLDKIYTYVINDIFTVDGSKGEVMLPTKKPILTLITCSNDQVNRVIVRAKFVDAVDIELANDEMIEAFNLDQGTW